MKAEKRTYNTGNYYKPEKQSKSVRKLLQFSNVLFQDDLTDMPEKFPVADGLFRIYGQESMRLVGLARNLMWDIHSLHMHPELLLDSTVRQRLESDFGEQITVPLSRLKKFNIMYSTDGLEQLPAKMLVDSIRLGGNTLLTPYPVGMPVLKFLLWLKGDGDIPSHISRKLVAELSGIDYLAQDEAYEWVVRLLKGALAYMTSHCGVPNSDIFSEQAPVIPFGAKIATEM